MFSDDMSGFVSVGEAIPDVLLEIRYYSTFNFIGDRIDGYERPVALLTREAAARLKEVSGDLAEKGLLDETVVWWTGEFGRTPKIAWEDPWQGGRNHFCNCFSAMVAGGGFAGGKVVGVSDETASRVVKRPVSPVDLLGSIFECCGIEATQPFPDNPINLKSPILPDSDPQTRLRELYL